MKIGFLTAVLNELDFEKVVAWASRNGFEALEVAAHPGSRHIGPLKF